MLRPLLTFLIALAGLGSFQALGGAFGHSIAGVSKGAPLAMATGGDTVRPPSPRRGADPVPASSAQAALIPRGSALHEVRALVKSHGERWISLYESAPAAERALVEQNLVEVFARVQKDQRTQQLVRPLIGDGELTVRTGIHHALRNVLKTDTGEVSDFSSLERVLVAGYEALSPTDRMRLLLDAIAAADDGERLGAVLYRLGPGYVKLGQILSSRADLVRGRHAVTLQKLTDDVPPVPEALIQKVLDDHRGALHEKLGTAPTLGARLGTGSVGQTHLLHVNDQRYVVKVQQPDVAARLHENLNTISDALADSGDNSRALRTIIDDLRRLVEVETDFRREAHAMERARAGMGHGGHMDVPDVKFASEKLLVMTEARGGSILKGLPDGPEGEVARRAIAQEVVLESLDQLGARGFFHGDIHKGNVFWDAETHRGTYIDWGLSAEMTLGMRANLLRFLVAIQRRKPEAIAEHMAAMSSTAVAPESLLPVAHRVLGQNRPSILDNMNELMIQGQLHGLKLESGYGLAGKTLFQLEGLARTIDPAFDMGSTLIRYPLWKAKREGTTVLKQTTEHGKSAWRKATTGAEKTRGLVRRTTARAKDKLKALRPELPGAAPSFAY